MNQTLSVMVSGAKSFCVSAGKKIKSVVMDPHFVAVMLLLVVCTVAADAQSMDSGAQAIGKATFALMPTSMSTTPSCRRICFPTLAHSLM